MYALKSCAWRVNPRGLGMPAICGAGAGTRGAMRADAGRAWVELEWTWDKKFFDRYLNVGPMC